MRPGFRKKQVDGGIPRLYTSRSVLLRGERWRPGARPGPPPRLHGPHQAFNNTPARGRTTLLIGLSGSRCGGSGFFTEQRATWRRSPLLRRGRGNMRLEHGTLHCIAWSFYLVHCITRYDPLYHMGRSIVSHGTVHCVTWYGPLCDMVRSRRAPFHDPLCHMVWSIV